MIHVPRIVLGSFASVSPGTPAAAKTRAKAKAKPKGAPKASAATGVTSVEPMTASERKSAIGSLHRFQIKLFGDCLHCFHQKMCFFPWVFFGGSNTMMFQGASIKKELATMSVALDLPKDHALRTTIEQYKKRFEDYSDELSGKFRTFLIQYCDITPNPVFSAQFQFESRLAYMHMQIDILYIHYRQTYF